MRLDHLQRADIALSKCGRPLPPGDGIVAIDIPYGIRYQAVVAAASTQQQPVEIEGDTPFYLSAISGIQAPEGTEVYVQFRFPNGRFLNQALKNWLQDPGVGSARFVVDPEIECPPGSKIWITSSTAIATPTTASSFTVLFEGASRFFIEGTGYAQRRIPWSELSSNLPRVYRTRNQNICAPRWMTQGFPGDGEKYWYVSAPDIFPLAGAAAGVNPFIEVATDNGYEFQCMRVLAVFSIDEGSTGTPYIRLRESRGYQITDDYVNLANLNGQMFPGWWRIPPGQAIIADLSVVDSVGSGNLNCQLFYEGIRRKVTA